MKESVMKYNGKGLAMEPQKIALRLEAGASDSGGANSVTFEAKIRVSHPGYDCSKLFIHDYSRCISADNAEGADSSFYGIAVCSEYEVYGQCEFCALSTGQ